MGWKNLFLSFDGRINRKPYWLGMICIMIAMLPIYWTLFWLSGFGLREIRTPQDIDNLRWKMSVLANIVGLIVLYPSLAVMIKRLHDRNRTGLWAALLFALGFAYNTLPLVGLASTPFESNTSFAPGIVETILVAANAIVGIWFFIELAFLKGTQGPNRFGPDPLGATQADAELSA